MGDFLGLPENRFWTEESPTKLTKGAEEFLALTSRVRAGRAVHTHGTGVLRRPLAGHQPDGFVCASAGGSRRFLVELRIASSGEKTCDGTVFSDSSTRIWPE